MGKVGKEGSCNVRDWGSPDQGNEEEMNIFCFPEKQGGRLLEMRELDVFTSKLIFRNRI